MLAEFDGERQADIAETDDADVGVVEVHRAGKWLRVRQAGEVLEPGVIRCTRWLDAPATGLGQHGHAARWRGCVVSGNNLAWLVFVIRQLRLQRIDFGLEGLVFAGGALQVVAGERHSVTQPFGCEQVGDFVELVAGAAKSFDLDVALIDETVDQVVGLADTDAQGIAEFALGEFGVLFQQVQDAEVGELLGGHAGRLRTFVQS